MLKRNMKRWPARKTFRRNLHTKDGFALHNLKRQLRPVNSNTQPARGFLRRPMRAHGELNKKVFTATIRHGKQQRAMATPGPGKSVLRLKPPLQKPRRAILTLAETYDSAAGHARASEIVNFPIPLCPNANRKNCAGSFFKKTRFLLYFPQWK